jgi:catechol 2,3-dioxygenase-like lactoylglutathione lyase family enzyme
VRIIGLDHVQLAMPVGREAEARAFYGDILGLNEITKPPELAARGGAWFENEDVKIHLGVDRDFRPAQKAHPGILVFELAALCVRLRNAGYRPTEDEPLPGYDRVYVDDPFGNRLEFMERRT